jgi:hypothetical protein
VPFSGGENISLIGIDIHKRYCLGIIEENNKVMAKMGFSNTEQGWFDFLKKEEIMTFLVYNITRMVKIIKNYEKLIFLKGFLLSSVILFIKFIFLYLLILR